MLAKISTSVTVMAMKSRMPEAQSQRLDDDVLRDPFAYDFVALAMTMMPYIAQMTLIVKRNISARRTKSRSSRINFFNTFTSISSGVCANMGLYHILWLYATAKPVYNMPRREEAAYARGSLPNARKRRSLRAERFGASVTDGPSSCMGSSAQARRPLSAAWPAAWA